MTAITLLTKSADAQTIGWAHQRVYLQLGNTVKVVAVDKGRGSGTSAPIRGDKTDKRFSSMQFKQVQDYQIISGKKFNVSIISKPRSIFPETFVMPQRTLYLTDILYTASQQ
jgi:hypothetical protein